MMPSPPSQSDVAKIGIPALDEYDPLREAAMWVVLTWDTQGTQHATMPALREALGLPREPPTLEEARARLNAYIGIGSS